MKKLSLFCVLSIATIVANANIDFAIQGDLCIGQNVTFLSSNPGITCDSSQWVIDTNLVVHQLFPSYYTVSFGYGEHSIVLQVYRNGEIIAEKDSVIFVHPGPGIWANSNDLAFCEGEEVIITTGSPTPDCLFTINDFPGSELTFPAVPGTVEYVAVATSLYGCTTEITVIVNTAAVPWYSPLIYQDGELVVELTSTSATYQLLQDEVVLVTKYGNGGQISFGEFPDGVYSARAYYSSECLIGLGEVVVTNIPLIRESSSRIKIISLTGVCLWEGNMNEFNPMAPWLPEVYILVRGDMVQKCVKK